MALVTHFGTVACTAYLFGPPGMEHAPVIQII